MDGRTDSWTMWKQYIPPLPPPNTNTVCGGYKNAVLQKKLEFFYNFLFTFQKVESETKRWSKILHIIFGVNKNSALIWASSRENLSLGFATRVDSNQSAQSQNLGRGLKFSDKETRGIMLSRQRTTKVLIRLRGCAGWSAPLLFEFGINRFSHDVAHFKPTQTEESLSPPKEIIWLFASRNWISHLWLKWDLTVEITCTSMHKQPCHTLLTPMF